MKQPLVVLTLVAAGSLSAAMVFSPRIQAQTTVESTATPEKPVQLVASPMKLTIKLGRLEAALVNKPIEFTDMSNYKCEGVVINKVSVQGYRRYEHGLGHLDVLIETTTDPGHDKGVYVKAEILSGQTILGSAEIFVDAEESGSAHGSNTLPLPEPSGDAAAEARLVLTVTVKSA